MRLLAFATALAACSSTPSPDMVPVDAGAPKPEASLPPQIALTEFEDVFVVRGRSATGTVNAQAFQPSVQGLEISVIDLPPGVTAPPAKIDVFGNATFTFTAASDAPISSVSALAVMHDPSGVRGTGSIHLAVTTEDGALDPTFGTNGLAHPTNPMDVGEIALADGGGFWATLYDNGACKLARLAPDATLESAIDISPFACTAFALDASGGAGVLTDDAGKSAFLRVDASGNVSAPIALDAGSSIVWAASSFLVFGKVATSVDLVSIDDAGQTTKLVLPMSTCTGAIVSSDGSVLAFGYTGSQAEAYRLVSMSQGWAIDLAFGVNGHADLGAKAMEPTAAASDGSGGFFVGVDTNIVHIGANGKMIASVPVQLALVRSLVLLPAGDILAIGDFQHQTGLARFTAKLTSVTSFGAFGFTATPDVSPTYALTPVHDPTAHLYVSNWQYLARFTVTP